MCIRDRYKEFVVEWINNGASVIGGCCRTTIDHIKEIKKIEISTDQKAISEKEIQTLTDSHISKIDEIFISKEKEILSI